jgi:DNA-binding transcriptional regulator YdaS (Cro superfamily)
METTLHGCPQADAFSTTLYARALHRACVILGGIHPFALHLGVSDERLEAWLEGRDQIPTDIFLRAVEVIVGRP